MITLAKASCGGYPGGAIGMSEELAAIVADGTVKQYGTFNGNPLVMAAAQATLTEVLTDDVYAKLEAANRELLDGCQAIIDANGLPAYTEGLGAKGCVIFSPERMHEYRDYLTKVDDELSTLAWLYHMNHGIFMTPGDRGGVDALDRPRRRRPPALPRRLRGVRPRRDRGVAFDADRAEERAAGRSSVGRRRTRRGRRRGEPSDAPTSKRSPPGLDAMRRWEPGGIDELHGLASLRAPEGIASGSRTPSAPCPTSAWRSSTSSPRATRSWSAGT